MNKSLFRLCLTATIAFIAGTIFMPMALVLLSKLERPGRYQQKREAITFFYKTMNELFEGTYNPEEGYVLDWVLEKFEEYKLNLGGKCKLFIIDSTPGYYECYVFFPSGDLFSLVIDRRDGRGKLGGFHLQDWDRLWKDTLDRYGIKKDSNQPKEVGGNEKL